MQDVDLIIVLACYLLVPLALKLASWYLEGFFKGIVLGITVLLIVLFGSFPVSFFAANIFQGTTLQLFFQGATLQLFSVTISIGLAFPYWKFLALIESLTRMGERLEQSVYQQARAEISQSLARLAERVDGMFAQMARRIDSAELTTREIINSVERRNAEVSNSVKQVHETLWKWSTYFEQFGNTLNEVHKNNLELGKKFEEFKKIPNAGEADESARTQPEEPTPTPKRLTTEDGRRARLSGEEWQKWMGQLISDQAKKANVRINLENNLEKSKPDFVLRHPSTNRPASVGAGKSYTLYPYQPGRHKSSQRTVTSKMTYAELEFAKRHKLPFFILVVNQRTAEWWSHTMSKEALNSFKRVTTPSWLAEDQPPQEEVERNHQEFIEFLKSLV